MFDVKPSLYSAKAQGATLFSSRRETDVGGEKRGVNS